MPFHVIEEVNILNIEVKSNVNQYNIILLVKIRTLCNELFIRLRYDIWYDVMHYNTI